MTPNQTNVVTSTQGTDAGPNLAQTAPDQPQQHRMRRRVWGLAIFVAAFMAVIVYYGIHSRVPAESRLQTRTEQPSVAPVTVPPPKRTDQSPAIVVAGETQALT